MKYFTLGLLLPLLVASGCNSSSSKANTAENQQVATEQTSISNSPDSLPQPYATKSVMNFSKVIGWENGRMPTAPAGFTVTKFASELHSPRNIYVAPNGDILVSEAGKEGKGKNQITLFRDADKDGSYEIRSPFLDEVNMPYGMVIIKDKFYLANQDAVVVFPYKTGDKQITTAGKTIYKLPDGGRHWTRSLLTNADGSKLYIGVGSASDHAEDGIEKETNRACIIEINTDGSGALVYGAGLRNPCGMAWAPGTSTLWAAVNERDELGDDLVPDYITSVQKGCFYGWPYSYFGQHVDPRIKEADQRMDLVKKAIVPDVPVGAHTASLGLCFYTASKFPEKYRNGAFVGQHGSWNRSVPSGYKVIFVPFKGGKPSGKPEDFLTGFIADSEKNQVYGRPVGVAVIPDGSLLVADDASGVIWRVSAK